jgi:hypothetical protein
VTDVLYFAPVAWDSPAQRPHHVVRCFLDAGREVTWVDPYPGRRPGPRDLFRRRPAGLPQPPPSGLTVIAPRAWPVEPLPGGARLNGALFWRGLMRRLGRAMEQGQAAIGVGRPSALAALALRQLPARLRFYDAMDDFPLFYGGLSRRALDRRERDVLARVDRLFVSSSALVEKFRARGAQPVLMRNALDSDSLPPPARRTEEPPVLGYVGTIGDWFDWPLVVRLAEGVPRAEVRLIGPCAVRPRALPPNVNLLGPRAHRDAMREMAGFSCGLIPFRTTPLTASVDPVKYYEYRGLGLPVLSTRFGEMADRGEADGVFALGSGGAPAEAVSAALRHPFDAAAALVFRERHDWRRRLADAGLLACVAGAVLV